MIGEKSNSAGSPIISSGRNLLDQVWKIYRTFWKKFIGMMFLPVLFMLLLPLVFIVYALMVFVATMLQATAIIPVLSVILGIFGLIALVAFVFGAIVASYGQIFILRDLDKNIKVTQAFKVAASKFWSFVLIYLLFLVVFIGGMIALVIPALIFSVWFVFSEYVLAMEDIKGIKALKRSRELVRGFWWTVTSRILFWLLVILAIRTIVNSPVIIANLLGGSEFLIFGLSLICTLVFVVLNLFILPASFVYTYLIYKELKAVKNKDAKMKDGLSAGKKLGVVGLIILYVIMSYLVSSLMPAETEQEIESNFQPLQEARIKARDSKRMADISQVRVALELYYNENEKYPQTAAELVAKYFSDKGALPIDPITNQPYTYYPEPDGSNYKICAELEADLQLYKKGMNCWDMSGTIE